MSEQSSRRLEIPRVLFGLLFVIPGTLKLVIPFETLVPNYGGGEPMMRYTRRGTCSRLLAVMQVSAGVMLLVGRWVPVALTMLAPILVNITLFHVFLQPTARGFVMSALVVGLEAWMVRRHWRVFAPLFA